MIFHSDVSLPEGTTHLPIGSGGGKDDQVVNMWNPISINIRTLRIPNIPGCGNPTGQPIRNTITDVTPPTYGETMKKNAYLDVHPT